MKRTLIIIAFWLGLGTSVAAQETRVTPSTVNAYSQGATTAFLTFSNVVNKRPADACWCGELVEAAPDVGFKCKQGTEFGCLPVRYNQSRLSNTGRYTDIMSIPPSVARRAYVEAAGGAEATFFYVRRFVSTSGGPDEFVPVTIRLGGNGASAPFSVTNVKLTWGVDKPVLLIKPGEKLPKIQAEITYTGTGRLKGRWELVKPGEELPSQRDLLTESTLPVEERGKQRRYTELSRFNVLLPPVGRTILPGPESWRMPSHIDGMYLVLLRIEAADDAIGADAIATGGVAGFAMPTLRYYVGAGTGLITAQAGAPFSLASPDDGALVSQGSILEFSWNAADGAAFYRIELQDSQSKLVLSATLTASVRAYRAPSWLKDRIANGRMHWRVVALDARGQPLRETPRRLVLIGN
ncbi:MAG TPA: hypothetical protein VNO14_01230 [Blastocatellia bacterium]|nr:hypothetical protein [Blastocatellia bacterium]